jgi:hypothetical protein
MGNCGCFLRGWGFSWKGSRCFYVSLEGSVMCGGFFCYYY